MMAPQTPPGFDPRGLIFLLLCDHKTARHDPIRLVFANQNGFVRRNHMYGLFLVLEGFPFYSLGIINQTLQLGRIVGVVKFLLHFLLQERRKKCLKTHAWVLTRTFS